MSRIPCPLCDKGDLKMGKNRGNDDCLVCSGCGKMFVWPSEDERLVLLSPPRLILQLSKTGEPPIIDLDAPGMEWGDVIDQMLRAVSQMSRGNVENLEWALNKAMANTPDGGD